jgi:hypothetical protein
MISIDTVRHSTHRDKQPGPDGTSVSGIMPETYPVNTINRKKMLFAPTCLVVYDL